MKFLWPGKNKPQETAEIHWMERLKGGLSKSRHNLVSKLKAIFSRFSSIDDELWDEVEEALISADVGVQATLKMIDDLKARVQEERVSEPDRIFDLLREELMSILRYEGPEIPEDNLVILMMIGVNGVGKTTTIAKMGQRFKESGKEVLFVAADTFRAAAIEQLETLAQRIGIKVVKHQRKADPASVVYDAVHAAKSRDIDVMLVDTAGRLHTYVNLMEELKKIRRIIEREAPEAHLEVLLVMDATTGQNGIAQARLFNEALRVNGIVLTKLDGTARGGIVVAIADELKIPIRLIGIGEGMDDLQEFYPEDFIEALLSE